MLVRRLLILIFCISGWMHMGLAQNKLFYAGNAGAEAFYDVVQLSDRSILIGGMAENLDWLPDEVERINLGTAGISNNQGNNRIAFLLRTDSTLNEIQQVLHFAPGAAEDIRFVKTTNAPRTKTGALYISGNTLDTNSGGYFIARLDNNFVDGLPTTVDWVYNVKCEIGDYPRLYQPWDVDAQGRVYFVRGDSHDFNWSAMHRLTPQGELDVVNHWRTHWKVAGGEYRNTPASDYPGGLAEIAYSGIVFKKGPRCNLRSWTSSDYNWEGVDGNGGLKKGKWPLDALYDGPCDPTGDEQPTSGPGYTGYSTPSGTITYGPSSVCVDRRNGHCYLGFNTKSQLPNGNPDFEPAVMAMDATGQLLWWSRLYHELRPDGTAWNSSPDQYIDALAIDYSRSLPESVLVVAARCHGNNNENFWEGNTIAADPAAFGFQNRFTGTSGNIHIGWLGKLTTNEGTLLRSTYVAEYANESSNLGSAHANPLLDGWPDPNQGWPTLNTTRLQRNALKVTANGSVIILGQGRRTLTTSNAHQKMPKPGTGQNSAWNAFVRQYQADLTLPLYSSLVVGEWDPLTQQPPKNTTLYNAFKVRNGILIVGQHDGTAADVPVVNPPAWGKSEYHGASALIGYFEAQEIVDPADAPPNDQTTALHSVISEPAKIRVYPNPSTATLFVESEQEIIGLRLFDGLGRAVLQTQNKVIDLSHLPAGGYLLMAILAHQQIVQHKIWKQ
ncbi:MAG: T9SS type A sorting domain-containing protein [Bacteroidota bacterium]